MPSLPLIIRFYPVLLNELEPCIRNEIGKVTFLYDTASNHFHYNSKNEVPLINENNFSETQVNILKIQKNRPGPRQERQNMDDLSKATGITCACCITPAYPTAEQAVNAIVALRQYAKIKEKLNK